MAGPDDVLRRVRPELPEHLASPTSAAAQALLEEILSMQTTGPDVADPTPPPAPRNRSRRRLLVVAAASVVAFAAAAFVAIRLGGDDGPSDDVKTVPSEQPVPERTGRIRLTWRMRGDDVPTGEAVERYEFSGDDIAVSGAPYGPKSQQVVVDGQTYEYMPDLSQWPETMGPEAYDPLTGPYLWVRSTVTPPMPTVAHVDQSTLFDQLGAAGPFEDVGTDEVEGVPTRRVRATRPELTPYEVLKVSDPLAGSTATGLDVWVDESGGVLRVDMVFELTIEGDHIRQSLSIVWSDLGEPITIEPPPIG